nr:hypothetical protein [Delftia sp. PE138]
MGDWMPSLVDGVWIRKEALPFKNRLVNLQLTEAGRRGLDGMVKWSDIEKSGEVPKHWPKEQP